MQNDNTTPTLEWTKTGRGCYATAGVEYDIESSSLYSPMRWEAFYGDENLGTFDTLPEARAACEAHFDTSAKG